jgi:hypothetical protein
MEKILIFRKKEKEFVFFRKNLDHSATEDIGM